MTAETTAWWIAVASIGGGTLVALGAGLLFDAFPAWLDALLGVGWLALVGGLSLLASRWPRWEHRHAAYAVHDDGLDIWKGIVWRRVTSVPRSRVQHTDVEQGPLQRRHGIASLVVHTAGTSEARVRLDGLEHDVALRVRDYLLQGEAARGAEEADGGG